MKKAKEILEGFSSLIMMKMNLTTEELNKLQRLREDICMKCPERRISTNTCKKCGCYIPAKTSSRNSSCPLKHW